MSEHPREPATERRSTHDGPTPPATRTRIVDGAIRCLIQEGVTGASMSAIATASDVSKALLHYHFADRTRLLAATLTELVTRTVSRERYALEHAPGHRALDSVWTWLAGELARRELRALLELSTGREPELRAAADAARGRRHRAATRTVELVFDRLGLTPRFSTALLGAAHLTFVNGLVIGDVGGSDEARANFDVFWLALLDLVTSRDTERDDAFHRSVTGK